jgi:DMSO/TMAO reductase YedYZ molybdopterin-dependent catalytic subunit
MDLKYNSNYINAKEEIARIKKNNPSIPSGQKLTSAFPILDLGIRPNIPKDKWNIHIFGLVKNEKNISFNELINFPKTELTADFNCVTGWTKQNIKWIGVSFKYLVDLVEVSSEAKFVIQSGYDGYTTNLPLDSVYRDDVIVAYKLYENDIPSEHGGFVRMIVPSRYGWKGSKFLNGIFFSNVDIPGFWEVRGYHNNGDWEKEERYS